jgi:hypothetical protein
MVGSMGGLAILAISVVMGAAVIGLVLVTFVSGNNSVQEPWQVVKDNVTVTGRMASVVICSVFAASCPPECCTSIDNIQLINYRGEYYYARNVQQPTCHQTESTITATDFNGHAAITIEAGCKDQVSTLPITIWFTNSTVYCISPAVGPQGNNWGVTAPTCPS